MKRGATTKFKFLKFQRRLGLRLWQAVGLLETLWSVTYDNAPAGDIGRLSNEDIAVALDWEGDADALIQALIDTGWLDPDEEFRLIVHDWSEHCAQFLKGNFAKHGREFADVVAKQRAKQSTKQGAKHGAKSGAWEGATKPSLAESSQAKPKEAYTESSDKCSSACDEHSPSPGVEDEPVVLSYPTKSNGQKWDLKESRLSQYQELYPEVDVKRECSKARQWCMDNPSKRKTAKGMPRFLTNWLGRASKNSKSQPAGYTIDNILPGREPTPEELRMLEEEV